MEEKNYEAIIEAILFTMGESVELDKIANAIELDKQETKKENRKHSGRNMSRKKEVSRLSNWTALIRCVRRMKCMNI